MRLKDTIRLLPIQLHHRGSRARTRRSFGNTRSAWCTLDGLTMPECYSAIPRSEVAGNPSSSISARLASVVSEHCPFLLKVIQYRQSSTMSSTVCRRSCVHRGKPPPMKTGSILFFRRNQLDQHEKWMSKAHFCPYLSRICCAGSY